MIDIRSWLTGESCAPSREAALPTELDEKSYTVLDASEGRFSIEEAAGKSHGLQLSLASTYSITQVVRMISRQVSCMRVKRETGGVCIWELVHFGD